MLGLQVQPCKHGVQVCRELVGGDTLAYGGKLVQGGKMVHDGDGGHHR